MAIEQVAGESATGNTGGQDMTNAPDVGSGQMHGDDAFALPNDFDSVIDDGIELPEEGATPPSSDGTGSPSSRPTGAPGTQPTGAAPVPGAAAQPAQAPGGQQPPQPTPTPQPAPTPQGQPQAGDGAGGPAKIYSPAELAQQLHANRGLMIDALAQQKFALTPAEIQALEVDAVGVLPKIMARVYYEATVNGLQQLANMVPRMVESVVTTRIGENSAEEAFHTEWPNIDPNNAQQMKAVQHFANSYRQMNPRASQTDAIKFVGTAVTQFFGLQMPQRANGSGAPRGGTPLARPRTPPFAPAQGGRAAPLPGQPQAPAEPFLGLGMQFDEG